MCRLGRFRLELSVPKPAVDATRPAIGELNRLRDFGLRVLACRGALEDEEEKSARAGLADHGSPVLEMNLVRARRHPTVLSTHLDEFLDRFSFLGFASVRLPRGKHPAPRH